MAEPEGSQTQVFESFGLRLADFVHGEPTLPSAVLISVTPPTRGSVYAVTGTPVIVGRAPECDIAVLDERVSRRHAQITGDRDELQIEDLGSRNGTLINGNHITGRITLRDGDLVGLGAATLYVRTIR